MNKINQKKNATIQVDLDGLWTNLEYYGYKSEVSPDTIFESSIPRFLELFEKYNIKATFFLVGKDGENKVKAELMQKVSKAGHEIANHTYSHTFGFRKLPTAEKIKEIEKGEEVIEKITGKKPVGFKTPGFDFDLETLNILEKRGYIYDSSIIATPVYPLIMKINNLLSGGKKREHGPRMSWLLAPNKMYNPSSEDIIKKGNLKIKEAPCSVMPLTRLPFHPTFAAKFGQGYFNIAYKTNLRFNNYLNYAFHAADLADNLTDQRLGHLSKVSFEKRFKLCEEIVRKISLDYEVITTKEMVERANEIINKKTVKITDEKREGIIEQRKN